LRLLPQRAGRTGSALPSLQIRFTPAALADNCRSPGKKSALSGLQSGQPGNPLDPEPFFSASHSCPRIGIGE